MYILSHACVYRKRLHIRYIYTQLHPYIHTPYPIPFTYTNQPMLEHLNTSNPTRVPYAFMPHLRRRYDNPMTPCNVRIPLYHVPATLRDYHMKTGIRNHPTNPTHIHMPTLTLVHERMYAYYPSHRQAYGRNPQTL